MPDVLTPAERALIDAFPAHKIKRLPTIARPAKYVWTGGRNPGDLGRLVLVNPETRGERLSRIKRQIWADKRREAAVRGSDKSTEARRAAAETRRAKVAELRTAGKTIDEIAAAVGAARSTVKNDLKAMGIKVERVSRLARAKRRAAA